MSKYFDNKDSFLQPQVIQYGSHMVMTNVVKETKHKIWNIDTKFRDDYDQYNNTLSGSQISQYYISLPQPINDVKSITVCNMEIPMSFYNISTALENNIIKITNIDTKEIKILIINDGYYTQNTLKTEINNQLDIINLSDYIYFDIDISNNKSILQCIGDQIYEINFAVKNANICGGESNGINVDFDKYNFKNKLGWILGFRNITYNLNSQIKSESFINLYTMRYLYLVIDEFSSGNQSSFISPMATSIVNKNIIAKISLDFITHPFLSILPANTYNGYLLSDKRSYTGKVNLQKLKLQLINEYGNAVNLNGMDFSFALDIEYE